METPDLVGQIIGFRSFDIFDGKLWPAAGQNQPWSPGTNRAVCRHPQFDQLASLHQAPDQECCCGIYANYELDDIPYLCHFKTKGCVVGAVEMWGRIEAHPTGLRAQYARPVLLAIPPRRKVITRENFNLLVIGPLMGLMSLPSAYILLFLSSDTLYAKLIMSVTSLLLMTVALVSYKLLSAFFRHQKIHQELTRTGIEVVDFKELSTRAYLKGSPLPVTLRPKARFRDLRFKAKLKRLLYLIRSRA